MWDISTQGSNVGMDFGDIAAFDGSADMSIAVYWELPAAGTSKDRIFGKGDRGVNGWNLEGRQAAVPTWVVDTGSGNANSSLTASTQYGLALAYDGSNANFFLDGVADGTPAVASGAPIADTGPIAVGYDGVNAGVGEQSAGGFIGQPVLWEGYQIDAAGATLYQNKVQLPSFGEIVFWARGKVELANAIIPAGTAASENGSVAMHADAAVDDAFPISSGNPMGYLVASYWLPLIAGAKLLGSNLMYQSDEKLAEMWAYIQRVLGVALPDMTKEEVAWMFSMMNRKAYSG
jgi:hypothetical protein